MKITIAQQNYKAGDCEGNTAKIIEAAKQGKGSSLVVFPELAVCGGMAFDLFRYSDFIEKCERSLDTIAEQCREIPILVGCPVRNIKGFGKPLYNAAVYLYHGERQVFKKKQLGFYHKLETNYFEPDDEKESKLLKIGCHTVAVTIGDDLCNAGDDPVFISNHLDDLMKPEAADLIVNIAAIPFDYEQPDRTTDLLRQNMMKFDRPVIFANAVGANTNLIYAGGSKIFGYESYVVDSLPVFEECVKSIDMEVLIKMGTTDRQTQSPKIQLIHDALVLGIKDYFVKHGFKKAVLGLSGGLDSALVMELAAEAIGAENVLAVLMPSQFSTDHSVSDAEQLVKNLGSPSYTIPIKPVFDSFDKALKPFFGDLPFNVAEENLQARIRGVLVMALSNKFGNILLNTSNKSEAAVGYGTLYGDLCGSLSVIGDVYKTEVFEMARWINRNGEIIPTHIIEKAPSAELRPNQKDSDSLPDYSVLDKILYQYIECGKTVDEIVVDGFDRPTVERTVQMVRRNEYKRHQVAPILKVSPRTFGEEVCYPL